MVDIRGFLNRLGWKTKEKTTSAALNEIGIFPMADEKLTERLVNLRTFFEQLEASEEELKKPNESPLTKIGKMREHLKMIDVAMKELSVPYGRAGDQDRYRLVMTAWERLYAKGLDVIEEAKNTIADYVVKEEKGGVPTEVSRMEQAEVVDLTEGFLRIEILPYANMIMDYSYFREDVAPSHAVVVQSYMPPTMGGMGKPGVDPATMKMILDRMNELEERTRGTKK